MGYSPENCDQYTKPLNEDGTEAKVRTEEENEAMKAKFDSLKKVFDSTGNVVSSSQTRYSKKDTDDLLKKVVETKKNVTYSAHRMDFNKTINEGNMGDEDLIEFDVECHNCHKQGYMRMCTCSIPYFKEIIIMAFTCENCLTRSTEVKVGGSMSDKATKYTITCKERDDMDRDIFKSETAEIEIPEIGVVVVSGSLGGVYSTIEGLLDKMLNTLRQENPFIGDSAPTN
jgi:hypothetical protein